MKKIIVFFMTLVLIFTMTGCGKKPSAKIENEDIRRSSYKFNLTVDDKDIVTKGSVLVNFYKISKKDEVLVSTKTLTTFNESVSVTGLESDTDYRCDVLCTYDKKSHIIYSWVVKTKKDGTEFDPIVISTANEFVEYITSDYSEDAYYELANDIDFNEYSNKDEEGNEVAFAGVSPTSDKAFAGYINGNGHTIKNVNITSSGTYNGFFGYLKGTLEDINFENINISVTSSSTTTVYTGAVSGYTYQAKFINVSVNKANISVNTTTQYTGGVVGRAFATNFVNSNNSEIDITSTGGTTTYVGGITSFIEQNSSEKFGKILNATVDAKFNITKTDKLYFGGAVGYLKSGATLDKVVANVDATIYTYGQTEAAGLVGNAKMADSKVADRISNVVAKGKIVYKSIKETDVTENSNDVIVAGLIASATAVKLSNTYSEMELDIEAKLADKKVLYASLVFGRGFDYHTTLSNSIINGKITSVIEDADTKAKIHGYDGSTYIDGGDEIPLASIDYNTVKYINITLNESVWADNIDIKDAAASAKWDLAIWDVTVDETNNKINVKFN